MANKKHKEIKKWLKEKHEFDRDRFMSVVTNCEPISQKETKSEEHIFNTSNKSPSDNHNYKVLSETDCIINGKIPNTKRITNMKDIYRFSNQNHREKNTIESSKNPNMPDSVQNLGRGSDDYSYDIDSWLKEIRLQTDITSKVKELVNHIKQKDQEKLERIKERLKDELDKQDERIEFNILNWKVNKIIDKVFEEER